MSDLIQVFLAHASEDKTHVRDLHSRLARDGFKPWLDELDLPPGSVWPEEIPKAIRASDVFLACLSTRSVHKQGYIQKELRLALVAYSERPPGEVFLIPVRLDDCEIPSLQLPELGIDLRHFQSLDLWEKGGYERLVQAIRDAADSRQRRPKKHPLQLGLERTHWERLEKSARDISAAAGFAAMGYYRNALGVSMPVTDTHNPSTLADENATVATLQSLSAVDSLAAELGYQCRVFAEELDEPEIATRILGRLHGNTIFSRIKTSTSEFRRGWEHSLSILLDAIDGTSNFGANLPFFCSAVAIFLGGRLSVGAIYDPFHHQVFYGSLRILPDGSEEPSAHAWTINAGIVEDLRGREYLRESRPLLATHVTRSDARARTRFLRFLPHLCDDPVLGGGTYMLNSGQMALAHVASGHLGAFVNNTTGIWDVAAGEVLIRAVGGRVTDFNGRAIDYGESNKVSVVASRTPSVHDRLCDMIDKHYPWNE